MFDVDKFVGEFVDEFMQYFKAKMESVQESDVGGMPTIEGPQFIEPIFRARYKLEWKDRIKVALELARLLKLLHKEQYLICNLSAAHIMIDQDKKPVLYDFSMLEGQVLPGKRAANNLKLIGSAGYRDPYTITTDSKKVPQLDIFAFGVMLLSLICKRDMSEMSWTFVYKEVEDEYKSKFSHAHESFVNHPFFDPYDGHKLSVLAMDCLQQENLLNRPTASEIVKQLESLLEFSGTRGSTDVEAESVVSNVNTRESSWRKYILCLQRPSPSDWQEREQPRSERRSDNTMSKHEEAASLRKEESGKRRQIKGIKHRSSISIKQMKTKLRLVMGT